MVSASTSSANEPAKDIIFVPHSNAKPVYSEKTRLKKLMIMIIIKQKNHLVTSK